MSGINPFFSAVLQQYSKLRGKEPQDASVPFWDAVVITSSDSEQKDGFELQIESKLRNKELPLVKYHVLADPPGSKIGCGGSTFCALQFLKMKYGDALSTMRILLIHAGGYSQRLPSHSLCGKLFSCLPLVDSDGFPWQMLDLKLATFMPFLKRMAPGFYITASDDIVTYLLDGEWNFESAGFTALAHHSSLVVGSTHGVYVLPEKSNQSLSSTCWMSPCRTVLQKPSFDEMRQAGAVRKCRSSEEEYVYSDSSFYFDHSMGDLLLTEFPVLNPLSSETDVYGDFLQPLGTEPNSWYIDRQDSPPELERVRRGLFSLLLGKPLSLLVLEESSFYHIGTVKELIFHFCHNQSLIRELCLQRQAFSLVSPSRNSSSVQGVLMQSIVNSNSVIGEECILEYCRFDVPIVTCRSVISGCQVRCNNSKSPLVIPERILLFTSSVHVEDEVKWTCGAVHFDDNVKKTFDVSRCGDVIFMGKKLSHIYSVLGEKDCRNLFDLSAKTCSLWNARIFPVCSSMDDAFISTIRIIRTILESGDQNGLPTPDTSLMSLEDFVKKKAVKHMIEFRDQLKKDISLNRKL